MPGIHGQASGGVQERVQEWEQEEERGEALRRIGGFRVSLGRERSTGCGRRSTGWRMQRGAALAGGAQGGG
jgi:hypothetical protein